MVPAGVGAQKGQCLLPTASEVRLVLQLTGEAGDEPVLGTETRRGRALNARWGTQGSGLLLQAESMGERPPAAWL